MYRSRIRNRLNFHSIAIGFVVALILNDATAYGKDPDYQNTAPDTVVRSSIHETDGYAYLSEDMTLAETRSAAFSDAKRRALDMAETYIRSKTKVKDFTVEYDIIWIEAEGAVTVLESKDLGIEDNSRYHVWIRAEVEYEVRPKKKTSPFLIMEDGVPLTVNVWTGKKSYRHNEEIKVYILGNRGMYACVVNINPEGAITQLLPNSIRPDHRFQAGVVYKIPGKEDAFKLVPNPPYGRQRIVIFASDAPLGTVPLDRRDESLWTFHGSLKEFEEKIRPKGPAESGTEFYKAVWELTTEH